MNYLKEAWVPGEQAHFEYHCWESDESSDADLWHHSHQIAAILHQEDVEHALDAPQSERLDAGQPNVYKVRFSDGLEGTAFEDELFVDPAGWYRPDPPKEEDD